MTHLTFEYTAWFAALHGLVLLALSCYISYLRITKRVSLGDGGDKYLNKIIRAHANLCEFAPILLIMSLLLELKTGSTTLVLVTGAMFTAGRMMHAVGIPQRGVSRLRQFGALLNYIALLVLPIALIVSFI